MDFFCAKAQNLVRAKISTNKVITGTPNTYFFEKKCKIFTNLQLFSQLLTHTLFPYAPFHYIQVPCDSLSLENRVTNIFYPNRKYIVIKPLDSNTTNIAKDIFIIPTEDIHNKVTPGCEKLLTMQKPI